VAHFNLHVYGLHFGVNFEANGTLLSLNLPLAFCHRRNFVCDLSPPLFPSGICIFSYKNTNFSLFFGVWARESYFLLPEAFCGLKDAENAIAAEAPPRTPLRELTTLPQIP